MAEDAKAPAAAPEPVQRAGPEVAGPLADLELQARIAASHVQNIVGPATEAAKASAADLVEQFVAIASARARECGEMAEAATAMAGAKPVGDVAARVASIRRYAAAAKAGAAGLEKLLERGIAPRAANYQWPVSVMRPNTGDRSAEKVLFYIDGPVGADGKGREIYIDGETTIRYNEAVELTRAQMQRIKRRAPHFVEVPATFIKAAAKSDLPIYFATGKRA